VRPESCLLLPQDRALLPYAARVSEPQTPPPAAPAPAAPQPAAHPDRLAALTSGFVAVLALVVSTYNVYLQRQQTRAQVWPRLHWSFSNISGFQFNLQNAGVGPAEVKGVCVFVDDKPVANWDEVFGMLTKSELSKVVTSGMAGKVFTPGEMMHPLDLQDPASAAALGPQLRRLRADICYCSTLEECWLLQSYRAPVPVDRCAPCQKRWEL
jgi:hypothetical protein